MTGKTHEVVSKDSFVSPADIFFYEPGLAVLAVGCLLFWPSGVKKSFNGFCGSMFVRQTKQLILRYTSNTTNRLLVLGYPH